MRRKNIFRLCVLFIVAIFLFVFQSPPEAFSDTVESASVTSVITGHNTCEQCHGRYPGGAEFRKSDGERGMPAKIPPKRVDLLCLGCHGPAGISKLKADVHGSQNYVIKRTICCITCHDPHADNPNYLDGENIKLIGRNKWNKNSNYAMIRATGNGIQPVVFEGRGTDAGEPSLHSFADGDEDRNGRFDGICEVCHTKTKYHRNNQSGDHDHYTGQTCTTCHAHVNQFISFSKGSEITPVLVGYVIDDSGNTWANVVLFMDLNGNGKYDKGEPVAVTDADGRFTFTGVENKGHAVYIMPGSIPNVYTVKASFVNNEVILKITLDKLLYPIRLSWKQGGGYIVGDNMLNAVFFYDGNGKMTHKIPELAGPLGILADDADLIYVGNDVRRNVEIYNRAGELQQILGNGELKQPNDIVLDRNGRVYVVDSANKNVRVFNRDGSGAMTISQAGGGGSFLFPKALAIHYRTVGGVETGELYVGDKPSSLIHIYDLQGNFLRSIGTKESSGGGSLSWGSTTKLFNSLQSMAFDQHGRLHVLDSYMSLVMILDPVTGDVLGEYNTSPSGQGSKLPMDIDINASGQVIMTSFRTRSVETIHTVR